MNNVTVDEMLAYGNPFIHPDTEKKLEELIKDRERLEFVITSRCQLDSYKGRHRTVMPPHVTGEWFDTPRAAIDAAMAKENM